MKRRNLGARLSVVAISLLVLAGFGSALGVAPAAAQTNPACGIQSPSALPGGAGENGEPQPIGELEGECATSLPEKPKSGASHCGCEPAFTIVKRQEIAGSRSGFTTAPLVGTIGQTVDYEIVVTNTELFLEETFSEFTDRHCVAGTGGYSPLMSSSGTIRLAPGASTTYTCSHVLTSTGPYTNEASVTGTSVFEVPVTQTSNQVVVEALLAPKPEFTIEKRQQIAGGSADFTTSTLTASEGQTVNYQIVVMNSGEGALTFSGFSDEHCDPGTLAGGPEANPVNPGTSTTYTCTRLLPSTGTYVNAASVTGTNSSGESLTLTSNSVEAIVPPIVVPTPNVGAGVAPAVASVPAKGEVLGCKQQLAPALRGASGPKRTPFTVTIAAGGIARIAFYLDGHKMKALTQAQARKGVFSVKIDPRKLAYGAHRVSVLTRMSERECPAVARNAAFVRPKRAAAPAG
jgi:hypothetical protein